MSVPKYSCFKSGDKLRKSKNSEFITTTSGTYPWSSVTHIFRICIALSFGIITNIILQV